MRDRDRRLRDLVRRDRGHGRPRHRAGLCPLAAWLHRRLAVRFVGVVAAGGAPRPERQPRSCSAPATRSTGSRSPRCSPGPAGVGRRPRTWSSTSPPRCRSAAPAHLRPGSASCRRGWPSSRCGTWPRSAAPSPATRSAIPAPTASTPRSGPPSSPCCGHGSPTGATRSWPCSPPSCVAACARHRGGSPGAGGLAPWLSSWRASSRGARTRPRSRSTATFPTGGGTDDLAGDPGGRGRLLPAQARRAVCAAAVLEHPVVERVADLLPSRCWPP